FFLLSPLSSSFSFHFFFNSPAPTHIYTLSLHDALPISSQHDVMLLMNSALHTLYLSNVQIQTNFSRSLFLLSYKTFSFPPISWNGFDNFPILNKMDALKALT